MSWSHSALIQITLILLNNVPKNTRRVMLAIRLCQREVVQHLFSVKWWIQYTKIHYVERKRKRLIHITLVYCYNYSALIFAIVVYNLYIKLCHSYICPGRNIIYVWLGTICHFRHLLGGLGTNPLYVLEFCGSLVLPLIGKCCRRG